MTNQEVPWNLILRLQLERPLTEENHTPTSPADYQYNCFAWAAGSTDEKWGPVDADIPYDCVWPADLPNDQNVVTFKQLFERLGFVDCSSEPNPACLEQGFQKIVLYVAESEVEHAARQLADGKWTSKMGMRELDMTHDSPDTLTGKLYGSPSVFMKRPWNQPDPVPPSVAKRAPNPLFSRRKNG